MKKFVLFVCFSVSTLCTFAQFTHGTTGLLEMPTADMQRDKTFMVGGNYLHHTVTPVRWSYNTWNYYINVTFFPWLEVAYTCTIFNEWVAWTPTQKVHMENQDRNYSVRLRLWKEGWWKPWTPQIVIGSNDIGTSSGDYNGNGVGETGNGYWNRYFLAVTKHLDLKNVGVLGIHATYLYNKRKDNPLNGPAFGVNYRFALPRTSFWRKALNGINLMAEYDSRDVNVGMRYSVWKDHINGYFELSRCKYPSAGICYKVYIK